MKRNPSPLPSTELVDSPPSSATPGPGSEAPAVIKLIDIGTQLQLFHDSRGSAYAVRPLPTGGSRAVALSSATFRAWLSREYYQRSGGTKAASAEALSSALNVLTAKALDGPTEEVHVRVAERNGSLYLDLANERGEAVEMTRAGWRVTAEVPVRFRCERTTLPLPMPQRGGTLEDLRPLVNAPGEEWRLMVAWLVAALRPGLPFPILVLQGEQGSAKSTTGRMLRTLIDPSRPADRARPRDERDLAIAARNAWVLSYDNLSGLPEWLSDAFCRISTGSGFATRALHTDTDEAIFEACRPVMLNGIDELLARPDLADRAVRVMLPVISEERRRPVKEVWEQFETQRPRILGALCDTACGALRELPTLEVHKMPLPRMADFALWAVAAERALAWPVGAFLSAYQGNRGDLLDQSLESDAVASAIRHLLEGLHDGRWKGTAAELLEALAGMAGTASQRGWPENPRGLVDRLRRAAPVLRALGIEVAGPVRQGHERRRVYTLKYAEATGRTGRTGRVPGMPDACTATGADDGGPIPAGCGRWVEDSMHRSPSEADAADAADATRPYTSGPPQGPDGRQQ